LDFGFIVKEKRQSYFFSFKLPVADLKETFAALFISN